jgi:hypothetical protein
VKSALTVTDLKSYTGKKEYKPDKSLLLILCPHHTPAIIYWAESRSDNKPGRSSPLSHEPLQDDKGKKGWMRNAEMY